MHFQCMYENETQDQDMSVSTMASQSQVSHNQNDLPPPYPPLARLSRSCAQTPTEQLGRV